MPYLVTESLQSLQNKPDTTANINLLILRTPRCAAAGLSCRVPNYPVCVTLRKNVFLWNVALPGNEDWHVSVSINSGLLRVLCGWLTGHFSFRQLSIGAPFTFTFVPVLRKLPSESSVTVPEGSGPQLANQVWLRRARCDGCVYYWMSGKMYVPLQHVRLAWWISFN